MSNDRLISIYIYFISGEMSILATEDYGYVFLILLPFRVPKLAPNISSSAMVSSLVTGKFGG